MHDADHAPRSATARDASSAAGNDASLAATDDASHPVLRDASGPGLTRRLCAWCEQAIPAKARRDAVCCSVRCRQARHRFLRAVGRAEAAALTRSLRLAYADPPYAATPGCTGTTPTTVARSTTPR
jgi:hypothetical protein